VRGFDNKSSALTVSVSEKRIFWYILWYFDTTWSNVC